MSVRHRRREPLLIPNHADLSTPFGLDWATKLFGAEAVASLPVRTMGKHKGTPKGVVIWRKAAEPGWASWHGPVQTGQFVDAWIGPSFCATREHALSGQWLGRVQPLAASAAQHVLFAEGRARWAAEQARLEADWATERAEMLAEREATQAAS